MNENVPFIWRVNYRNGFEKITGHDLEIAHEKARQYLGRAVARSSTRLR
jgi:hypothetical protein